MWPVKMDPVQIDQILANLCVNAKHAIADVGRVTIEMANAVFVESYCAHHAGFVAGEYVLLASSDDGCGMNQEILDHIFEPFFTSKGWAGEPAWDYLRYMASSPRTTDSSKCTANTDNERSLESTCPGTRAKRRHPAGKGCETLSNLRRDIAGGG